MPLSRAACLLLVSLLFARPAAAQPSGVVVSGAPDDPLTARVQQELSASGLRVRVVGPEVEPALHGAFVRVDGDAIQLWVEGAPSTLERTDDATTALAVAETVRARLAAPAPTNAEPAAALEDTPSAPIVGLWVSGGVGLSPGEIPPFVDLTFGLEVRVAFSLYVEVFGTFAVPESQLTQRRFDFTFWTSTFGAGLGYSFFDDDAPVALRFALGCGPTFALVDGEDASWAVTPYARVAFSVRLIGPLSVRLDGMLGVALPELDLRFRAGWRSGFGLPRGSITLGPQLEF